MTTPPTPHFEMSLQRDTDQLRNRLLEMAALDERALTRAFEAFLQRDRQQAYGVILCDQDIDAMETELDRLCVEFIVRHQPAAAHLRFVYSASKIVNELERIGDYAESIARQVLLLGKVAVDVPMDKFSEMASLAIPMMHNAVRAFAEKNADLARATIAVEPQVNQIRDSVTADLLEWREDGRLPLEALAPFLTVARRFERVSDQATNICEEALYFATGEYLRHMHREGFRILFVDEANGCLSRMAEAAASTLDAPRFTFSSAGIEPAALDPQTVRFLADKGVDAAHDAPVSVAEVPLFDQINVIVSLSRGAHQALPHRPAKKTVGLDWFIADPSKVRGTPEEVRAAYEKSYESLTNHARDLVEAILGRKEERRSHDTSTPPR